MGEAANEQLGYRKKALRWLRKRGDIIGIAGVVAGVAIGVGVPVWQNNFVEVPELSIEINGISRKISADAALPSDDEVLSVLFRGSGRFQSLFGESGTVRILSEYLENEGSMVRRSLGRNRKGYKPEVVQVALEQAKEELKGLPDRIDSRQQEQAKVDILTFETITHADVRRLNRPISPEVNVTQVMFERNASDRQNNQSYFNRIMGTIRLTYHS